MSDYLENKMVDQIFRGQSAPTTSVLYVALYTSTPSDAGGGTEVSGGAYARTAVTSNLTNWAGTQSTGSTATSSGSGGTTSNNSSVTFPTPSASWGIVTSFGIFDAASSGNLLFYGPLSIVKTINNGDTITFPAASLAITFD